MGAYDLRSTLRDHRTHNPHFLIGRDLDWPQKSLTEVCHGLYDDVDDTDSSVMSLGIREAHGHVSKRRVHASVCMQWVWVTK